MDKEVIQEGASHTPPKDPHTFRIQGKVTIRSGDDIIAECQDNHMIGQGLKGFISFLCCQSYFGSEFASNALTITGPCYNWTVYLGNDVATATTNAMTNLVTQLSTLTPVMTTGSEILAGGNNYYYIRRTAHFGAGLYTGTIGEIGLYLGMPQTVSNKWTVNCAGAGQRYPQILVARFSVGDGNFASFSYPQNNSLTVEWEIGVSP